MNLYNPDIDPRKLKPMQAKHKRDELELYKTGKEVDKQALKSLSNETQYSKEDIRDSLKDTYYAFFRHYGVTDRTIQKNLDNHRRKHDQYLNSMEKQI